MAVIATGNHPKALWPGVLSWFGNQYNQHEQEWTKLFDVKSSTQAYEEIVEAKGFGLAPVKPEGTATAYDSNLQGYTSRFTNVAYSLGYICTREELADNLYEKVAMRRAGSLARSMMQTRENVGANVYNRVVSASYVGGDAVALGSTAHPSVAGNQSNILATTAALSEASLEDLSIQMSNALDPKGLKAAIRAKTLIIPTALEFDAQRILKSMLRSGTADNDGNALKLLGAIPEIAVNHYLTSTTNWMIRTDVQDGLCWFDREATEFTNDSDYDTDNVKHKGYMRFVPGWADWRGLYASAS